MGSDDHVKSKWKLALGKQLKWLVGLSFFVLAVLGFLKTPHQDPIVSSTTSLANLATTTPSKCRWRPEPLQGTCDGTKSTERTLAYLTAEDCENACCESATCVSFQFRTKDGCLWGQDTRLGGEKDGPSSWCEPRPPAMWQGQWIKVKESGDPVQGACDDGGWNPSELVGQCFGLGSKKITSSDSPEACRNACCENQHCCIWQWRSDAGCFFNSNAFNCQEADPLDFQQYIGKRKVQEGRSYSPHAYSGDFSDMATTETWKRR